MAEDTAMSYRSVYKYLRFRNPKLTCSLTMLGHGAAADLPKIPARKCPQPVNSLIWDMPSPLGRRAKPPPSGLPEEPQAPDFASFPHSPPPSNTGWYSRAQPNDECSLPRCQHVTGPNPDMDTRSTAGPGTSPSTCFRIVMARPWKAWRLPPVNSCFCSHSS
jgi:hypothetical protein